MKIQSFLPVLALSLWSMVSFSQSEINYATLADSIQTILQETKAPGCQVAIFNADQLLWNQNFGVQDIEASVPVDQTTFFRIGSITKTFVATAILQMAEAGLLSLDDEISKYLDDVEYKNKYQEEAPIRIKHLLEHTTGFDDMHMKEYAAYAEGWSLKQGIDFHPDSRQARWKPGMHMSYCNSGPPLAAYIVEKLSGQTFDDYVSENIFRPLGMEYSSMLLDDNVIPRLSKGYDAAGKEEMAYWHISQRPAGSINSNATEMSRFIRMLINRGQLDSTVILSPASVARMERCETTLSGKAGVEAGYGLHNYTTNYKGMEFHGHNGGMMGFLAQASYHPESGYGFVILVNATNGALNQIARQIFTHLYEANGTEYPIETAALTPEAEKEILGFYHSATSRNQMLRMPDDLAGITKVGKDEDGYFVRNQLSNTKDRAYPVAQNVLMLESKRGSRSPMVFTREDGILYAQQVNWLNNLHKTNAVSAFTPLILGGLSVLFLGILMLYGLIWMPLKGLGVFTKGRWALRIIPIGLAITLFSYGYLFAKANEGNVLENLGTLSFYSGSTFILSLIVALLVMIFLWYRIRLRVEDESRWYRIVTFVASLLFLIAVYYLFSQDIIGLRTWAY